MASSVDIDDLLREYDIIGAIGCEGIGPRVTALVEIVNINLREHSTVLHVRHFSVEGFGFAEFWTDKIHVPADQVLQDQTVKWMTNEQMPPRSTKVWMRNLFQLDFAGVNFLFDESSFWMPLIEVHPTNNVLQHLELFAGGYGGWKSASDFMCSVASTGRIRTIAVEHDPVISAAYAITNHATFIKPSEALPSDFLEQHSGDVIICADVLSPLWKKAVSAVGIDIVSISSPCPAWTGANDSPGLLREDGALLFQSIGECRFLRPTFILIEQVSNFAQHPHRQIITRALHWIGYKLIFQRTLNVQSLLRTDRPRWFGVAVRVHDDTAIPAVPTWQIDQFVITPIDAVFKCWTPSTQVDLQLTQEAIDIAKDPRLTRNQSRTPDQVLQSRIYDGSDVIPTFMSMYGRQHTLNIQYLSQHKFYGHYLKDANFEHECRHWHPAEISLKHGLTGQCFQYDDCEIAWTIQGNIVTTVQVLPLMIACGNAKWNTDMSVQELIPRYLSSRWQSHEVGFQKLTGGFLMTLLTDPVPPQVLQDYDVLLRHIQTDPTQPFLWTPDYLDRADSDMMCIGATQISPPTQDASDTSDQEPDRTLPFQTVLKAVIRLEQSSQQFWFVSNLPFQMIAQPWQDMYSPCVLASERPGEPVVELMFDPDRHAIPSDSPMRVLMLLVDQVLNLMMIPFDMPVIDHPSLNDMGVPYDQFGILKGEHKVTTSMVVMSEPLPPSQATTNPVMLFAAFSTGRVCWTWNPMTDTMLVGITGPPAVRRTLADFWAGILPPAALRLLGRHLEIQCTPTQTVLLFKPNAAGVCPHEPFNLALAINAIRHLMPLVIPPEHIPDKRVRFMWGQATMWEGPCPSQIALSVLQTTFNIALQPVRSNQQYTLAVDNRQILSDDCLQGSLAHDTTEFVADIVHLCPVLRLQGGGGSAKQTQRGHQQSALAGMLLEQGHDLPWISQTVDTLMTRFGLSRIQAITSQPMGGPRMRSLYALCEEAKIEIPKPTVPASNKIPAGVPWKPKKRRADEKLDIDEFELFPGFFAFEDGSPATHITTVRPQSSGISLLSPEKAQPWIHASNLISSDELAIIIPGPPQTESSLPATSIRFPCYNRDKQMVIIAGTIYQLGEKKVQWKQDEAHAIATEACTMLALTAHREDFDTDTWVDLTTKSYPTIRKLLEVDGLEVQSMWGKSLRHGRAPASPNQASTLQVHIMLSNQKLDDFLRKSGFNHLYATPKLPTGRVSQEYKILWNPVEPSQAICKAAQIPGCLGLVKGKNSIGYRIKATQFGPAWDALFPGKEQPNKPTGDSVYKILGLPFGVTVGMMTKWLEANKWTACPFKALGPTGFLIRTSQAPPPGVLMFNGNPLLVQFLPDKDVRKSPILLGPRGSSSSLNSDPFLQPGGDPWAAGRSSQPPPPRTTTGPMEQKFKEHEEKIATLQSDMQKLMHSQETHHTATQQQINVLEKKTSDSIAQLSHNMTQLQQEVDKSLKLSLQQNSTMMDERMKELRDLLQRPQRKRNVAKGESDMESDG
eukprot:Skav226989  [mRNA]  locus=scaffold2341:240195:244754:- [translate_table: standard]